MSRKPAWALTLAVVFAVTMSPSAASAQRRVRITSVEIAPADAAIQVGRPQVFLCTAYDAANNPVPTATCVFLSSNGNVATVNANGIATGVGVGTVIITARVGAGATAKSAAATLTVLPTAPKGLPAPGVAAAPAIDCSSATIGSLNPNRSCYDQRPVPRAPLIVAVPESCTDPVTPVTVMLRVSGSGGVETASVTVRSNCAAFTDQAVAFARDLAFVPAVLRGTPVAAWTMVLVRPAPPELRSVLNRSSGPGAAAYDHQPEGSGPAEGLVVRPLRVVLGRGESRQLEYRTVNAAGEHAEKVPIVFTVVTGGERIVTVDSVGLIRTAGDTGVARVRVEVPGNGRIQPRQVSVEVRADSVRSAPVPTRRPPG